MNTDPVGQVLSSAFFRGGMTVAHLLSDRLGRVQHSRHWSEDLSEELEKLGKTWRYYQPLPVKDLTSYDVLIS